MSDIEELIPELIELARHVDHDDPDCPNDDTCSCENIAKLNAEFSLLSTQQAEVERVREAAAKTANIIGEVTVLLDGKIESAIIGVLMDCERDLRTVSSLTPPTPEA